MNISFGLHRCTRLPVSKYSSNRVLPSSRREQLCELPAIKPNSPALRASIQNHRFVDRAKNSQEIRLVARAAAFLTVGLLIGTAAAQRRDLMRILDEQLIQLLRVEPNAVASGTAVDGYAFHEKFAKSFGLTFWAFHMSLQPHFRFNYAHRNRIIQDVQDSDSDRIMPFLRSAPFAFCRDLDVIEQVRIMKSILKLSSYC